MPLLTILIIVALFAVFFGGYGHTRSWGYYGWSPLALVLLVVLVLWLAGGLR